MSPPQLSNHQRLLTRVEIQMDGADLAKRRGRGHLVIFVQLTDRDGTRYQNHGVIELAKLEEGIKAQDITYTQPVFVTPGDYTMSCALLDTETQEHTTRREKLHVAALKNDPFPDSWRNLPPIEFLVTVETPDSWYLPDISGRLNLPVKTAHPVRIGLLVNLTPSERLSGSHGVQDRNLGTLIPAFKAIAHADLTNASLDVALLDLSRRRVVFKQNDVHDLDWSRMKGSLGETDPGTIDVKALGDRSQSAAFFVKEVARRLEDSGNGAPAAARALIVLSTPVAFEDGEDLQPIHVTGTASVPVFYIRIHPTAQAQARQAMPFQQPNRRFGGGGLGPPRPIRPPLVNNIDQLEPTLKPLNPRLFDVETPEQFRKVLATVFGEISNL